MHILYQRLITTINEEIVGTTEYHIASLMLENINQLYQIPIGEMAALCSVSKSTVSKFVRRIGFDDYTDFKLEAMRQREKDVYIRGGDSVNITDYILEYGMDRYVQVLTNDIRNQAASIDTERIERLVEDIHGYKKIAAFGEIYSETAALNFQYKMSYYRKYVYTTINDRKQEHYIAEAGADTLLLIFSNSGRYISTFSKLDGEPEKECFNKTKARVVPITSNTKMEKDPRVDMCIFLKYGERVQNHPILYQFLIEQITARYQNKYGFPEDVIID